MDWAVADLYRLCAWRGLVDCHERAQVALELRVGDDRGRCTVT